MNKTLTALTATMALAIPVFAATLSSGINVGDSVSSFHPHHVTGPNKGTDACPPCTYGNRPMVQMWVNTDKLKNVKPIASLLNARVVAAKNSSQLKGFVIFVIDKSKSAEISKELEKTAKDLKLNDIALAWIDKNDPAVSDYKVNTKSDVKNTVFVYKDREVKSKYVNLVSNKEGLDNLGKSIDGITK